MLFFLGTFSYLCSYRPFDIFSVNRIHADLKSKATVPRVGMEGAVYASAVLGSQVELVLRDAIVSCLVLTSNSPKLVHELLGSGQARCHPWSPDDPESGWFHHKML